MCGVTGILALDGSIPPGDGLLSKTKSTLSHRGPDEWGAYLAPQIGIGHARLSIVDLHAGHQPVTAERNVIAFSGEIYNHIELRGELEKSGVGFRTTSDAEVALKAFEV